MHITLVLMFDALDDVWGASMIIDCLDFCSENDNADRVKTAFSQ